MKKSSKEIGEIAVVEMTVSKDEIEKRHSGTFQDIRNVAKDGTESWLARDLQLVLEYTEWRNFELVIRKAVTACKKSGYDPADHFVAINKKVYLGSGDEGCEKWEAEINHRVSKLYGLEK